MNPRTLICSIIGFATLTGTPIAGALISRDSSGGYTFAIIFSGVSMFAGRGVFALGENCKSGHENRIKSVDLFERSNIVLSIESGVFIINT